MRTNANREDRDRELSVQELETVSGGWLRAIMQAGAKKQENQEQLMAAEIFKNALQGAAQI